MGKWCNGFALGKNIIVLNDEAHHCYHRKAIEEKSKKLTGDARNLDNGLGDY